MSTDSLGLWIVYILQCKKAIFRQLWLELGATSVVLWQKNKTKHEGAWHRVKRPDTEQASARIKDEEQIRHWPENCHSESMLWIRSIQHDKPLPPGHSKSFLKSPLFAFRIHNAPMSTLCFSCSRALNARSQQKGNKNKKCPFHFYRTIQKQL